MSGWANDYWIPILLVSIAIAVSSLVNMSVWEQHVTEREFDNQISQRAKINEDETGLPEETKNEQTAESARLSILIASPLIVLAGTGGLALLLTLVCRIRFHRKIPFVYLFGLIAWVSLISVVPFILQIPLRIINPDWILPTNPALIMPDAWHTNYFVRVLYAVDVFLIWQIWLLSLGLSRLYAISVNSAVSLTGTLFVCFAAINALMYGG